MGNVLGAPRRSRHLAYLIHLWLFTPFLAWWLSDPTIQAQIGPEVLSHMRPIVAITLVYLLIRTIVAYRSGDQLNWEYIFPPIDVVLITIICYASERGPMSNLTMLFFFPMIAATSSLNVRWSLFIGVLVVLGTALGTLSAFNMDKLPPVITLEVIQAEKINVAFRLYFLFILASLLAYQVKYSAEIQERLGVAADRNRIAMDMHDGVQGHLISIASQMELLSILAKNDPERAHSIAEVARESSRQAADELRFLVQRMRSKDLESGFYEAMRQYVDNLTNRTDLKVSFQVIGKEHSLPPETENHLFRIAQESIHNVLKHGQASEVVVELNFADHGTTLTVRDDGAGFVPESVQPGVGLTSMADRARKIGAEFDLRSSPGKGTVVSVLLPSVLV